MVKIIRFCANGLYIYLQARLWLVFIFCFWGINSICFLLFTFYYLENDQKKNYHKYIWAILSFQAPQTSNEVMEDNKTGLLVGGIIGLVIGGGCYCAYRDAAKFYKRLQVSRTIQLAFLPDQGITKAFSSPLFDDTRSNVALYWSTFKAVKNAFKK